jgi:anti-sigma factor RsiW
MGARKCIKEILLSEYLDGELPADAEKAVREHLSLCRECNAAYERLKANHSLLLECLPDPNPPSHLKPQLLHKINTEAESSGRSGIMSWIRLGHLAPSASRAWAAAAACVVLVAMAVSVFQVQRHFDNKRILAEIDSSRAQWAARDFSMNPFDIDIQGTPLRVTTENPFKPYLNER